MNYRLVAWLLGKIALLIAATMLFSLPWAFPAWGAAPQFEAWGCGALCGSIVISLLAAAGLFNLGRQAREATLYRKEAMAVVGLSWILATLLGALPFWISGTAMKQDPATGQPVPMSFVDCCFESQSGFSTTGATVLTDIDNRHFVPRSILFWRSSTHFLGGLGIIVLFVAVLGQGSAGKALMRAEMPGPSKEGAQTRMQHTALNFAGIYCGLNVLLTLILKLEGMSWFDALCHAFGTMATGGFSTYDASLGHFESVQGINGALVEYTVVVFMVLAGTNFTLLYLLMIGRPGALLRDVEWKTYMSIILGVTALVIAFGIARGDFDNFASAVRYGLFQVVSILTTTGFGTHDFDAWNSFGRGVLFLLMFVGGCAGSTGGGLKVIRHILFVKILYLEIERAYHPTVVRPLRLSGQPVEDPDLRRNILVYFGLILFIFVMSWMVLVTIEPDDTWQAGGQSLENKLIDCASSVSATLNNIGPGLGLVGATQNYANFTIPAKILFIMLMMIGRLEIFVIVVLFDIPRFWRTQ